MKFTKSIIDELKLPDNGQILLWDDEVTGFGIRLTASKKTYIYQGRVYDESGKGTSRRLSLGELGILTLQEARKRAQIELAKLLKGNDPILAKKRAEANAVTLDEVKEEYLKNRRELKATSRADIERHLNTSFSDWKNRPAVDITREKVAKRFTELSDKSPAQANQAFRVLRALLNYARAAYHHDGKSIIIENPVTVLSETKRWNTVRPRSGRIPTDKIGADWNVLKALRNDPAQTVIGKTMADAVSFLLLTGARWSEMANLELMQTNLEEKYWQLLDPKNRNPVIFPLSDIAVDILEARPKKNKYVFPSRVADGHLIDARGVLDKIIEVIDVHITPHDLRRTFRAVAGECGIELWKTKLLMNHKISGDVTISHYTETSDLRYLRPEINLIANWIERQGIIDREEKVIPFRKSKK